MEIMCESVDLSKESLDFPKDNVFRSNGNYHFSHAEQVVIYLMGCLSELGNTKNSVIAVR